MVWGAFLPQSLFSCHKLLRWTLFVCKTHLTNSGSVHYRQTLLQVPDDPGVEQSLVGFLQIGEVGELLDRILELCHLGLAARDLLGQRLHLVRQQPL